MKKLAFTTLLFLLGFASMAQAQTDGPVRIKPDSLAATTTAQYYGIGDLPTRADPLGVYIWNTSAETLWITADGTVPTASNSMWLEGNTSIDISYPIRSFGYRTKNGTAGVITFWAYGRFN